MRFFSVAERELRAAARRKGTYRLRWIAGILFFGLLLWLAWVFDLFTNRNNAPQVFQVFAVTIFCFCLLVGATGTADCISREKREGTLGLLFLTNLNSAEIVAGKLCANALAAVYCLLAIFPILALPLMAGGITFDEFFRVVVAEVNALFFAIAAGFVASAVCVRQFPAVALATGLVVFFGLVLLGVAEVLRVLGVPRYYTDWFATFCPLKTLTLAAFGRRGPAAQDFWWSLATVTAMSAAWLGLVAWGLRHSWRDRPKSVRVTTPLKFGERWRSRGSAAKRAFRRRLLDINPFFWLAGRQRVSAPVFMAMVVLLTAVTSFLAAPYFGRKMGPGTYGPVLGHLFSWVWGGLAIHAFVLYYAAAAASRQLAEDKQSGVLELILSTPASEPVIARGLWLAYARRMLAPGLIAILTHVFFTWVLMTMMVLSPPGGRLPAHATAGELFWSALWGLPLRGHVLDWQFSFMLHIVLLLLAGLAACWVMLGWVGRWLGLRMKHPGFAPLTSVALAIGPPVLIFSLFCFLAEEWRFFRLPERQVLPIMMWIAFGITMLNCLFLSWWAAGNLRENFRATVIERFSDSTRRWWQLDWPKVRRRALQFAVLMLALVLLVAGFYAWQNWRARRAWAVFQQELRQKGGSLDVTPFLPQPVPDAENFARTPVFLALRGKARTNSNVRPVLDQLQGALVINNLYSPPAGTDWLQQQPAPLTNYVRWMNPKARLGGSSNRAEVGAAILQGLEPHAGWLRELSAAARLPALQFTTDRSPAALLVAGEETALLERLHLLLQVRACAALAAGRTNDAAADLLTGLRLARLARQLPDARASIRVQIFLARSLQPLWEGLAAQQWTGEQLAAFQRELSTFNLLADHTSAVRRITLFYIASWRDSGDSARALPRPGGPRSTVIREASLQPGAWQYYNCIQIHEAGERAIANVDVAGGRVRENGSWADTSGLPLDSDMVYFLQQGAWWGAKPAMVSFAQTSLNQAVVACALERHRLARGRYPETIEELVPAFLDRIPADTQRGRPLLYQFLSPERFILRGVGQNGTDDRPSSTSDDWLWAYSTNAPAGKQ